MENIRFGKLGASDEEVYAAARAANAHEFITSFPEGYRTIVGECRGPRREAGARRRQGGTDGSAAEDGDGSMRTGVQAEAGTRQSVKRCVTTLRTVTDHTQDGDGHGTVTHAGR